MKKLSTFSVILVSLALFGGAIRKVRANSTSDNRGAVTESSSVESNDISNPRPGLPSVAHSTHNQALYPSDAPSRYTDLQQSLRLALLKAQAVENSLIFQAGTGETDRLETKDKRDKIEIMKKKDIWDYDLTRSNTLTLQFINGKLMYWSN